VKGIPARAGFNANLKFIAHDLVCIDRIFTKSGSLSSGPVCLKEDILNPMEITTE
jgi:hypothetical protein